MKAKLIILITLVGLLAGCASTQPSSAARGPYVKPGLVMLTADQAEARGISVAAPKAEQERGMPEEVKSLDTSAVVTDPSIKVYTFGRMVDPADRNVMHEEHAVYRRETAPQWKLQAHPGQQIIVGPRVTDSRQNQQALQNQELDSYLADQRKATLENRQAIEVLFKGLEALNQQQKQSMKLVLDAMQRQQGNKAPDAAQDKPTAATEAKK